MLRWVAAVGLVLAALLIGARLVLPSYLRSYVNRTLERSRDYSGRIGRIDVHLWRGAYSIDDVRIVKTTNLVPVPFFEARRIDFSLDWSALLHGQVRGKLRMDAPRINFVHGPAAEDTQTGADEPWLSILDDLFPFRIDKARINDGQIHFEVFHSNPRIDVYLSHVQATLTNQTNIQNTLDPLVASVHATGDAMGSGRFEFDMKLDPASHRPTFELATRLLHMDVTRLNSLTLAYGDFDFESGRFDLVVELSAKDGVIDGYAKPLFRNLKVLTLHDIKTKDPLQLFWEALVGLVGAVFKNQGRDQFGTRITLHGDLSSPRTSLLEIVGSVLHNAFVRAYLPRLDNRTTQDMVSDPALPDRSD